MDVIRSQPQHGWIEVVTGSMFSGKSEELIRRMRRAQIARQRVQIFKPLIDNFVSAKTTSSPTATCGSRLRTCAAPTSWCGWWRRTPKSLVSTKASSSTRTCRPRAIRWRTKGSGSSSPDWTRIIWAARSNRCRSCSPSPSTSPRRWQYLRRVWRSSEPHAASRREQRSRPGRRDRSLRSAVPALFRSTPRRRTAEALVRLTHLS